VLLFLLGCLVTLVLTIAGNLLTPGMKPLWATVTSWSRRGVESQTRQQLKVLQVNLDQLNRFEASDRDLYLYLFRWLLAIIAFLVAAFACAFLATSSSVVTPKGREELTKASFTFLIFSLVCCVVVLGHCGDYTVAGTQKKKAELEDSIAKLVATLPGGVIH
jgi:hypothetical protein